MAAITDFTSYKSFVAATQQAHFILDVPGTMTMGVPNSLWTSSVTPGVAPTTPVVPTNATVGSIGQSDGGAGNLRLASFVVVMSPDMAGLDPGATMGRGGTLILVDRLSHQGGLVANSSSEQTTNLPTAALTRYTDGVGVVAALEIYTLVGNTATTVTASYTNQAGTAGRTSVATAFGGSGSRSPTLIRFLPLQVGDTGVRSVESVTLAATTGSVGGFGVTLFKPLAWIQVSPSLGPQSSDLVSGEMGSGMVEIVDDACLSWLYSPIWAEGISGECRISGLLNFCET